MEYINHDCNLIMEAIRRLIDGTWHLHDDDQIYSWELFPKIKSSLLEHVSYEEATIFPTLSVHDCELHRSEHRRMLAQLWSVETALQNQQAEYFQDLLRGLQRMLDEHHQEFSSHNHATDGGFCSSCHAQDQIQSRSHKNTL